MFARRDTFRSQPILLQPARPQLLAVHLPNEQANEATNAEQQTNNSRSTIKQATSQTNPTPHPHQPAHTVTATQANKQATSQHIALPCCPPLVRPSRQHSVIRNNPFQRFRTMADVTMADATADGAKFDLEILATALSARGTNGVKHLDYRRYRQYCARRLRRMRTNKNVNFTHGKSRSYANRRIGAADVTDVRFLMIPLFMAERCWSTAQELHSDWANAEQSVNAKDDDTDIGGGAHLRWRLHAMRRMAKAAYWSHQLKELCSQVADDRTVLEAEAYAATMSGWTHYIRDDHQEALLNLRRAETVYTQLHSLGTTSQQAVYAQQLDTIQPLIKWCQAQQGVVDGGAHATTTPGDLNILADEGMSCMMLSYMYICFVFVGRLSLGALSMLLERSSDCG
jgi:hypothetical protein